MTLERKARVGMDALLAAEGTHVCDMAQADVHPAIDVAIREFPLSSGFGFADYLFHVRGWACGVVEVSKQGAPLLGVELQSGLYLHTVVDGVSVANLQPVKVSLKCYERATIASLPNPESFDACASCTITDTAISLDNMRKLVNKLERAKRPGNIPYLGANGQTGWIDVPLLDEELVVEDETSVGHTELFCYYFADPCWLNHHSHLLRARPEVFSAEYRNLALSYYPFISLTAGLTGLRKLTQPAHMPAPISGPSLNKQAEVIDEVEHCLPTSREVLTQVDANLQRVLALCQANLAEAVKAN